MIVKIWMRANALLPHGKRAILTQRLLDGPSLNKKPPFGPATWVKNFFVNERVAGVELLRGGKRVS